MSKAKPKAKALIAYLWPEQVRALDRLQAKVRVPRAQLIREAVEDLLAKHKVKGSERPSRRNAT